MSRDLRSLTEHTDSLHNVLLPCDQRAKLCLEWDVLLIQRLARPETALMGVVIWL